MLIVKKISSILLAFLVLFSTFSFTVEKHYCGDFLVDVSYFGEAENCGTKMEKKDSKKKKNCCKDEVQQLQGQDNLQKTSIEKITFKQQEFLVAYAISFQQLFQEIQFEKDFYKDFSPPDITQDYQVLYETFLI